jgi:DNA-binding transcriptional ArsR family regulator
VTPRTKTQELSKVSNAASVFAALGDVTRLQIVIRLCDGGPQSIVRLTQGSSVSRQAVTKHLRALSDAGLVRVERLGRETLWELEPKGFSEASQYVKRISERWDRALLRLKAFVEE